MSTIAHKNKMAAIRAKAELNIAAAKVIAAARITIKPLIIIGTSFPTRFRLSVSAIIATRG